GRSPSSSRRPAVRRRTRYEARGTRSRLPVAASPEDRGIDAQALRLRRVRRRGAGRTPLAARRDLLLPVRLPQGEAAALHAGGSRDARAGRRARGRGPFLVRAPPPSARTVVLHHAAARP